MGFGEAWDLTMSIPAAAEFPSRPPPTPFASPDGFQAIDLPLTKRKPVPLDHGSSAFQPAEEILKSDRLFKNYYNCLIDQGPCTPDAAELKQSLPDALENNCSKCTPKQKETGYKVISLLIENRPAEWAVLQNKYDPERKFVEKYREEAAAAGIKL